MQSQSSAKSESLFEEQTMTQRRRFLAIAGAAAGAMAFPATVRSQSRSTTWVTHPAIFASTGDGELLKQFETKTGIKVEVVTFPNEVLPQRLQSEFVARSQAFDIISVAVGFWSPTFGRFLEAAGMTAGAMKG